MLMDMLKPSRKKAIINCEVMEKQKTYTQKMEVAHTQRKYSINFGLFANVHSFYSICIRIYSKNIHLENASRDHSTSREGFCYSLAFVWKQELSIYKIRLITSIPPFRWRFYGRFAFAYLFLCVLAAHQGLI